MNIYVSKMRPTLREMLQLSVKVLREESAAWFELTVRIGSEGPVDRKTHGDPWWRKGRTVFHLLNVIHDCIGVAAEMIDSSSLPADWASVLESVPAGRVFLISKDDVDRFAKCRWRLQTSDLIEKKRALWDVVDGTERLLGRAFPVLFIELKEHDTSYPREDSLLFETARELEHIIGHIESDLLSDDDAG